MKRSVWTLTLVGALCVGRASQADYVNPPGWDNDMDFTHQTWEFNTSDVPLVADGAQGAAANPFGDPTLTDVYLANPAFMLWVQDMMFGGTRHGLWGGMTQGLGPDDTAVAVTFELPNNARSAPYYKEVWIQAAYWGSITAGGAVVTVEIASDPAFDDVYLSYDAVAADIEDQSATGAASSGQYWRFTKTFELPEQPGTEYVRVSLVPAGSMAVFIDQVSIDTRCVAPPTGCAGDSNCDGAVNWRDIDFFVAAQNDNEAGWQALHEQTYGTPAPCPFANNDIGGPNGTDQPDGHVTWRDIDGFVALQNTSCP